MLLIFYNNELTFVPRKILFFNFFLGLLYESTRQPQDALACYNNAKGANSPHLHQRIKYLKAQLSNLPPPPPPPMQTGPGIKPKQLPSVEEAWNVPISNEMTSRHPAPGSSAAGASGEFKVSIQGSNLLPLENDQLSFTEIRLVFTLLKKNSCK